MIYHSVLLLLLLLLLLRVYSPLLGRGRFFSFLIYTQLVGLLGRGTSWSQSLYLYTEQMHANIHASNGIRTHDPRV
jgi:hypothetical protein